MLIAPAVVPTSMFQPPEMFPTLFPESSTTKSFHVPFATVPLKDDKVRPIGIPEGAGAGNVSPGSKSAGRNVPDESVPLSGSELSDESSNEMLRPLTAFDPPT